MRNSFGRPLTTRTRAAPRAGSWIVSSTGAEAKFGVAPDHARLGRGLYRSARGLRADQEPGLGGAAAFLRCARATARRTPEFVCVRARPQTQRGEGKTPEISI